MNTSSPSIENTKEKFLRGMSWATIGVALAQAASISSSVLTARLLGSEDYKAFSVLQSMAVSAGNVIVHGLGITASQFTAEYKSTDKPRVGRVLGLCSIASVSIAITALVVYCIIMPGKINALQHTIQLTNLVLISSLYLLFFTRNAYQTGVLHGLERFKEVSLITVTSSIVNIIACFLLIKNFGLYGACIALVLNSALMWLMYTGTLKRALREEAVVPSYTGLSSELGGIGHVSLPLALAGQIASLAVWYTNYHLASLPNGLTQLAVINISGNFRMAVLFVPTLVNRVSAPILNSMSGQDPDRYLELYNKSLVAVATVALSVAVILGFASETILNWYGPIFSASWPVLALFSLSAAVEALAATMVQRITLERQLWKHLSATICWALILVCLSQSLTPRFGALGLTTAYLVAWLFIVIVYFKIIRTSFRIKENNRKKL